MQLEFDHFELDTDTFEFRVSGRACRLEPKVFDLISHFVRNPGRVFSYDDLIAEVWRGRVVSETTVSTCIKNARKALGDSGSHQAYIRTVRGRGFRFDAAITTKLPDTSNAVAADATISADATTRSREAEVQTAAPALLIWPLRVLGDDVESAQLSVALAHDLARILARLPLLRLSVQARAEINDLSPGPRTLFEHLGVNFVFDGTVQRLGDQFRINAQLVDARSGFQLWGEQFTIAGPISQALDSAAIAIIVRLEPQLHRAIHSELHSSDSSPNSRQLFLHAASLLALRGWRPDAFMDAAELLRRSCQLDDRFALAHSLLALVVGLGERIGVMDDRERAKAEAQRAAERALALDSFDASVLGFAGCALADIGHPERALPILSNALELSPANAQAWAARGSVHLLLNQLDAGISDLTHGIAISPLDSRLAIWGSLLSAGLLHAGRVDESLEQGRLACQRDDLCYLPRIALAGAHFVQDRHDDANRSMREALRIKPDLTSYQIAAVIGRDLGQELEQLVLPR